MKLRFLVVMTFLLLAHVDVANADPASNPAADTSAIADKFLDQLKRGNVSDAYHFAFKSSEGTLGSQAIDSVSASTSGLLKSFGSIIDWSTYQTDRISPALIRKTYFVRCATIPLFVTMQFYNSNSGWNIIDVQLNSYTNGKNANLYGAFQEGH